MNLYIRKLFFPLIAACGAILLLEIVLRIAGYPHGYFAGFFYPAHGQYPKNAELHMTWGPFPYTVRTNNLGLRGPDISTPKKPKTKRIATIGDSVTDGYFVDNENTWQYYLTQILNSDSAQNYEVINCARGGGSVDIAQFQLKQYALPLNPDVVILTFVSNDISDLINRSGSQLNQNGDISERYRRATLQKFLLTQTAIGEAIYDAYLNIRFSSYRAKRDIMKRPPEKRYNLQGSTNFENNARLFLARFGNNDGLVLGTTFNNQTIKALKTYFTILDEMAIDCKKENIRLLFVYFPAYPQIYVPDAPMLINEILRKECQRLDVEFLDLTEGFRIAAKDGKPLHLAPIDYHLNPSGHKIFAQLLASYLKDRNIAQ
jgi:lysophospholipase L1-like esterase